MRIAIIGGSGFVGSYLIDELLSRNADLALLVRPESQNKISRANECDLVIGDIHETHDITKVIAGADCVIYCVGILRAFPAKGIDFHDLQTKCVRNAISTAEACDVSHFILMSANGSQQGGTAYQDSKYLAEQALMNSGLNWTIFRPSVLFGDPRGFNEFASQLLNQIVAPYFPAPLFFSGLNIANAGAFKLSPASIDDVAKAVSNSIENKLAYRQTISLGGALSLSWKEILKVIALTAQRNKIMLPVPAVGTMLLAALFDRFEKFPISRDQLTMLLQGNTCSTDGFRILGLEPKGFTVENLAYLKT